MGPKTQRDAYMLSSPVEIAVVFGVALLVFGPKKLPELGKALGQGIGNFKKAITDAQDEVKQAINTEEKASSKSDDKPAGKDEPEPKSGADAPSSG